MASMGFTCAAFWFACSLATAQAQPTVVVQTGHADEVAATAMAADGARVASADRFTLVLWDTATRRQLGSVRLRSPFPRHLQFVLADRAVLVESAGGFELIDVARVASTSHFERVQPRLREGSEELLVDTGPGELLQLAVGAQSRWIAIATVADGKCQVEATESESSKRWSVPVRQRFASRLAFSPSGHYLAVAGPAAVDVFDMQTGKAVGFAPINTNDLSFHALPAWRLQYAPDESALAIAVSNATTSKLLDRLDPITRRDEDADAPAAADGAVETIRVHDLVHPGADGALPILREIPGSDEFSFSPDGGSLRIVRGGELACRVLTDGAESVILRRKARIWAPSFAAATNSIAMGAQVGEYGGALHQVRLFSSASGTALGTLGSNLTRFQTVAVDAAGERVVVNSLTGLWDLDLRRGKARRLCGGFSSLLGVAGGTAIGRQMAEGRVFLQPLDGGQFTWIDFFDDDRNVRWVWLATGSGAGLVAGATKDSVVVKALPGGEVVATVPRSPRGGEAEAAAAKDLSLDYAGRFVALLLEGGTVEVFELASKAMVGAVSGIELGVSSDLRSHRPGSWLLATGREVLELELAVDGGVHSLRQRRVTEGEFSRLSLSRTGTRAVLHGRESSALLEIADGTLHQGLDIAEEALAGFVHADARLVGVRADGTLGVFDGARGNAVATICCAGESDSVWITSDGEYQATRGGLRYVSFRLQGQVYAAEQFDAARNRPDRVLAALGAPEEVVAPLRQARALRLQRLGLSESVAASGLPPRIRFAAEPEARTDAGVMELSFTAAAGDEPVAHLQIAVGGVPMFAAPGRAWEPDQDGEVLRVAVPLLRGANSIEAWVQDRSGRCSLPARHAVTCSAPVAATKVFAVGFGVGNYENARRLPLAVKDVHDLAGWLRSEFGEQAQASTFVEDQVGPKALLEARRLLEQADVGDLVIVHLAGHGIRDSGGRYWFAPQNMNFAAPAERGIAFEEVMSLIAGLRARHRLVLMDTCQAGDFERARSSLAPAPAVAAAAGTGGTGPAARGPDTEEADASDRLPLLQEFFVDVRRETGAFVLAAASGESVAIEADGNGFFTKAVLVGLESKAADLDGDQVLTVRELQEFVSRQVPLLSRGRQRPVILRENLDDEFPLVAARMPRLLSAAPAFASAAGYASLQAAEPSADGQRLLVVTNRVARVIDVENGEARFERDLTSSQPNLTTVEMSADGAAVLLRPAKGGAEWIDVATGRALAVEVAGLENAFNRAFFVAGAAGPCLLVPRNVPTGERPMVDLVDLPAGATALRLRTAAVNWDGVQLPTDERAGLVALAQFRYRGEVGTGEFVKSADLRRYDPATATFADVRPVDFPPAMHRGMPQLEFSSKGRYLGCLSIPEQDAAPLQLAVWDTATVKMLFAVEAPRGDVAVASDDGMLTWFNYPELDVQRQVPVTVYGMDGVVVLQRSRHAWDRVFAAGQDGSIGVSNERRLPFGDGPQRLDVRLVRRGGGEVWLGAPQGVGAHVMVLRGAVVGVAADGSVITWGNP